MNEPGPEFLITGPVSNDSPEVVSGGFPASRARCYEAMEGREVLGIGGVRLVFRTPTRRLAAQVWSEDPTHPRAAGVYILGWCYRIGSNSEFLEPDDYRCLVERHRKGLPPADDALSGNYVIVVYDSSSGRVSVQPDRWAVSAAYFWSCRQGFAVSNRAVVVADVAGAAIDGYSFLSLMRGTHAPFGRSLFLGVHRVLCGNYLSIDARTRDLEMRRAASSYVEVLPRTRHEAVDLVAGTVRDLARRLTRSEPSLFDLTGGHDTRLLAAGLSAESPHGLDNEFSWKVVGDERHPDVRIAREIARLCGGQIRRFDYPYPRDASRLALENTATQGDGLALVHAASGRVDQELTFRGDCHWLTGAVGGELLRGFWWGQEAFRLGLTSRVDYGALLDYRIRPSGTALARDLSAQWPSMRRHSEVLMEPYRQIGQSGGGTLNPYKLDAILQYRLAYSAGNAQSWLAGIRSIRLPFMSWEFTRVALCLPWHLRRTRDLSLRVIRRLNPRLSEFPSDTGAPMAPLGLSSGPAYFRIGVATGLQRTSLLVRRTFGRLGARVAARAPAPPDSWVECLRDSARVRTLFGEAVVRELCEKAKLLTSSRDEVRAFYVLLTLELLLGRFPSLEGRLDFREAAFERDRIPAPQQDCS